jgi:hypothetical protein
MLFRQLGQSHGIGRDPGTIIEQLNFDSGIPKNVNQRSRQQMFVARRQRCS